MCRSNISTYQIERLALATHHTSRLGWATHWIHSLWDGSPIGTESSDRQHTAEQTYITSGSSSAPSLHGFSPFLTFYCGQSPYTTIAWKIPFRHNAVLLKHGQSPSATKHDILCCSSSISCALIHLNTGSIRLQYNLNMAQNISIQPHCSSMQLQYSIPTS